MPEMVPEPKRSPTRSVQPVIVWCAIICRGVQYRFCTRTHRVILLPIPTYYCLYTSRALSFTNSLTLPLFSVTLTSNSSYCASVSESEIASALERRCRVSVNGTGTGNAMLLHHSHSEQ